MAQISIYTKEEYLKKAETLAKKENLSISKWINKLMIESFAKNSLINLEGIYGSIDDDSFVRPGKIDPKYSIQREEF